ncbi:T9SS type A sorting domain-containing protein [Hymenobacter baengnokdamensis]|uniref:T9SS type A sorting domain-containing protein n=1 Tax=Hymenobacter baengnokdamensis TaxID=2615203 RepID=UPI001246D65D|nr:T9SS type A sorting domain-containing protein [Hymenobacter baengnokdamensis]
MRFSLLLAVGLAATCVWYRAAAQVCPQAGIETDPPRATNPNGNPNTFNWYSGDYQPSVNNGTLYKLNSSVDTTPYLDLPWQQPNNINMVRFQGKNDIGINGWELIKRDLGYTDAGYPLVTSNPFVIIYNKYLGILRVFVTIQNQLAPFQFSEVKLNFSDAGNYKAATLNRMSALGVPLDETPKGMISQPSVVARYLNDGRKWLVADFPMDYDPCICQFDSRLQIEVNLIKKATVTLQATSTGSIVTSQDATAGTANGPSFFNVANKAINAAGTSFDSVDKLTGKLKADGASSAIDDFAKVIKTNTFLQNGLASLPYIGAAVGLLDFFIGGGEDSTPQPIALQPLAIQMSTKTTGTIQDTNLYVTPYFFNPGNRSTVTRPSDIPNYNEALGVISVLHRPVVDVTSQNVISGTRGNTLRQIVQKFRLTQNISYVINPAAGMTVQDFQVTLVAEGDETTTVGSGDFSTYEGNTVHVDPTTGSSTLRQLYRNQYVDAACVKNSVFTYSSTYQSDNPATPLTSAVTNMYVKLMVNLKPNPVAGMPTTNRQNVLLVARYPVTLNTVTAFSSIPTAACGVLAQASDNDVQATCSSSKYVMAVTLLKKNDPVVVSAVGLPEKAFLMYPNPATSNMRFAITTTTPGYVRVFLSNAMGREVKQVVEDNRAMAGSFETSVSVADLPPGIYYCTMQTAAGKVVRKLVVAP